MTDKELLQQALDALKHLCLNTSAIKGYDGHKVQPAIKAIKARLAQPEPAECDGGQCGIGGYCKQCPKTQPEPEPVAWISNSSARMIHWSGDTPAYGEDWKPLYTEPPKKEWVGLTDEEISEIYNDCDDWEHYEYERAIEAKLKEKNSD